MGVGRGDLLQNLTSKAGLIREGGSIKFTATLSELSDNSQCICLYECMYACMHA